MVGDVERVRRDAGELLLIEAHPAEFDFILLSSCVSSETSPSSLTYNTHTHTHTHFYVFNIYIYYKRVRVCVCLGEWVYAREGIYDNAPGVIRL